MEEEKVSVIVCVYNGEKYINGCLESILLQTYKNIEIIVVNDGSTDKTEDIVCKYPNIKYIYQKNKGIAEARNTGLRHCTGEYIAWLDSDDLYLPNKLELQVNYLQENKNIDCVYNNALLIDDKGILLKELRSEYGQLTSQDFLAQVIFRQVIPCLPSVMYRKRCFEKLSFIPNMKYAEDYWMTLQLAQQFNFGYLNKALYKYRRHNDNLTNNRYKQEQAEVEIVKNLGIHKIKDIIEQTSMDEENKQFLFSKVLIKIGQYKEASVVLEKIQSKNNDFLKYFYLGNIHYHMKNYNLAKVYYKEAIQIEPERAESYNNLGATLFQLKEKEKAIKNFYKALDLKKEYIDPKVNLENIRINNEVRITMRELRNCIMLY